MSFTAFRSSNDQSVLIYDSLKPFNNDYALPPLVYIHGGAWRDPSNTANDIDDLSTKLNKTIPLASMDYRLSPEVKHPVHLEDVYSGIKKIIELTYPAHSDSPKKVSLVGHSVGAMLALQVLNEYKDIEVEQLYLLDGIYDLEELIKEYPDYRFFVDEAHEDYTKLTKFDWKLLSQLKQVHVIQSYQDELLSLNQTKWLISQFESEKIGYVSKIDDFGKHDEVYKSQKLADYINATYYL